MAQSQASLTAQLKALIPLANQNGLYDAADFLISKVEAVEAKERADEKLAESKAQLKKDHADILYDADPDCDHDIEAKWSGVACTKCYGWYCL